MRKNFQKFKNLREFFLFILKNIFKNEVREKYVIVGLEQWKSEKD